MKARQMQHPTWRDLWAFLIYFVFSQVLLTALTFFFPAFHHSKAMQPMAFLLVSALTSLCVIGFLAWSHRHQLKSKIVHQLKTLKGYARAILLSYVIYIIINAFVVRALNYLPKTWQFNNTANQKALLMLFQDKSWLPLVFIVLVVLTPITEELLFRHILIGELGKKFGFITMGSLSVLIFTLLHVQTAATPFEAIPYLMMALLFVFMYIYTRCNIVVSIVLHMIVNGISFLSIILQNVS
ncbi:CPBP family intramembrane glutamic endopeptidase [Staphylococcus ratti]|uniref:CPBP family intramembrane metalloprotease n=1 Tax=Staphylococcus ratti TaxID=2892440 RepID=A0ABY3PC11_9STAP|nr:type II CAAX endopeptidase family protein [Staphylococcus ratti]UEX89796.1 CPBP family intramembrane metalloprotease [Staphylococcus ratti]